MNSFLDFFFFLTNSYAQGINANIYDPKVSIKKLLQPGKSSKSVGS